MKWNEKSGLIPKGGGVISSARGLMHEIIHALFDTDQGKAIFDVLKDQVKAQRPDLPDDFNFEEEITTSLDSVIGSELGEKATRRFYLDVETDEQGYVVKAVVPNPTFHVDP